ncbi:hypothetical protein NQZ68_016278 [Dissostichus eleginoides]|nr:hypothetical protein NQZ68_016278 [Dissostichus eleginoides]
MGSPAGQACCPIKQQDLQTGSGQYPGNRHRPPTPNPESTRLVVIETAGLHSLFISFNSSYFQDTCRDPWGGALPSTRPCPWGGLTHVIHPLDHDTNGCNVCQVVYTASYSNGPCFPYTATTGGPRCALKGGNLDDSTWRREIDGAKDEEGASRTSGAAEVDCFRMHECERKIQHPFTCCDTHGCLGSVCVSVKNPHAMARDSAEGIGPSTLCADCLLV